MSKDKRHDICTIFILSILCMGMLAIIVYVLSGNANESIQPRTEPSQDGNSINGGDEEGFTASIDDDSISMTFPPKETSFSYTQHQACGVKRNVYCVLLDNFSPSSDWQQRIRKTINQYIDMELDGGSASDYLIYFFQDSECYRQKIASRATEMCNIPNGEVAASSWGKIYYEYGDN